MRLQNLEYRATAADDIASQLRAAAQASIKSFSSRLSSTFGNTLSEVAAAEHWTGSAGENGSLRQNLVAGVSNSHAPLATLAPAIPAIVSIPATTSGLQGLVDAADGTTSGSTTGTSTTGTPAASTTSCSTPSGPAAPPTIDSPTQGLSEDPRYSPPKAMANSFSTRRILGRRTTKTTSATRTT